MTKARPVTCHERVEHSNAEHARVVLVDWMLGNNCSYACSYCPKALHDGSEGWQSADSIVGFYDQLHRHYVHHRGKQIWLQFTGGEPTMHPHIIKMLQEASARGFKVSLISNASRTTRFWRKITPFLNSVILTYHNEFARLDHFLEVAQIVSDEMSVHINVTMHPDRFDRTLEDARTMRETFPEATISLKPLRKNFETELYDYSDDELEAMDKGLPNHAAFDRVTPRWTMTVTDTSGNVVTRRSEEFSLLGQNHWKGFSCNAGLESLRIKGNGDVSRAVCRVGGSIGNIENRVALPVAPIICTKQKCSCLSDVLITKTAARGYF